MKRIKQNDDQQMMKLYESWTYRTVNGHLYADKYTGSDLNVRVPKFYDIARDAFEGLNIESLTLLRAEKLHHLWDAPMPGCEHVHHLTLCYSGDGAAFLHLCGWTERLPELEEIEISCQVPHQLILWEGVPNLSHDVTVRDEKCNKFNVYGHMITEVTLPTDHFFLSIPLLPSKVPDPAIRAAQLLTLLRKPELVPPDLLEAYQACLNRNGVRWIPVFMENGVADSVLLPIFREIQPLKPEKYETLLEAAQTDGNVAMAAAIVEEQNKYVDREKEQRKRERQESYDLDHPFSARNMKKEWDWMILPDQTVCLTKCRVKDTGTVYVPPEIAGKPVTCLGEKLFYNCPADEIVIPETVKRIESNCFLNARISSVTIPESVVWIGRGTFESCRHLAAFSVPKQITSLPAYMFYNASLQKIELHDGIKRIGAGAFTGCSQLKEIVLPEHIDTLPDHVFQGSGLTSITIPKKVQRIEGFAFDRCENLVSVVFDRDSELDYIGHDCFSFSGLKAFEVPESVSLIENYVFSFCGHLEHFECFRKTKLRKNALSDTRLKPVEQGEKLIWEAKKPKWMNMVDWKMIRAGSLNFQHRREAGKEALKSVH